MAQAVDYAALAKANGATSSTPPPAVDYDALAKQHGAVSSTPPTSAAPMTFARVNGQDVPLDEPSALELAGHAVRGALESLNPLPLLKTFYDEGTPLGAAIKLGKGLTEAQLGQFAKGRQAYTQGRYSEAFGHTLAGVLPVVGPAAANVGEEIGTGDPRTMAHGVGAAATLLAPSLLSRAPVAEVPVLPALKNPNAAEAAAVAFADRAGIPVDAASATGSRAVRAVQHVADRSVGGMVVGDRAVAAQEAALHQVGEQLAGRVSPAPVVPEQAGQVLQQTLTRRVQDFHKEATQNYDTFRAIEEKPQNLRKVQVATKDGQPVIEDMPLPVNVQPVKLALLPTYKRMIRQMPDTIRNASPGFKAMKNIIEGPDFIQASIAELDLGTLKQLARGADLPELRDISQGIAASGVKQLQKAIDSTVRGAGQDAIDALQTGRAATAEKIATGEVLKKLGEEPVQAFGRATWRQDAGIKQLRKVAKLAPAEMKLVGRAFLDDLLTTATREGGFSKAQTLYTKWQNLGPQTKGILYRNPALVKDLDNFFLFAKKAAENPNPSGTAHTLLTSGQIAYVFTHPATGVPLAIAGYKLSAALHNPAMARALTQGLKVSIGGTPLAQKLAAARILSIAGDAVQPLDTSEQTPGAKP